MKKVFLILIIALVSISSYALRRDVIINNGAQQHNHYNLPIPADQPDVYYDDDTQEIIIDGDGTVTYYDVEIASAATLTVLISTQVNGSYDTIDVSSLPSGHVYVITLYSPTGNTFEGTFLIE